MAQSDQQKIRSRLRSYERKLRQEKNRFGCYRDGAGRRYQIAPHYMLLGDYEGALAAFEWFEQEFDDDVGTPDHSLCWSLALHRAGNETGAAKKLRQAMLSNLYLVPHLLGEPTAELDIWHGSSDAEPSYVHHIPEPYPGVKVGRRWMISRDQLRALIATGTLNPPREAPTPHVANGDRYYARASYERLLVSQPHVKTAGLYGRGHEFFIVCPDAEIAIADNGQPIADWFHESCKTVGSWVSIVKIPPKGTTRIGERSLEDLVDLVGEPLNSRDADLLMAQLLGRHFPFVSFGCEPGKKCIVGVTRALDATETRQLEESYSKFSIDLPLHVEILEAPAPSKPFRFTRGQGDLHLLTARYLPPEAPPCPPTKNRGGRGLLGLGSATPLGPGCRPNRGRPGKLHFGRRWLPCRHGDLDCRQHPLVPRTTPAGDIRSSSCLEHSSTPRITPGHGARPSGAGEDRSSAVRGSTGG